MKKNYYLIIFLLLIFLSCKKKEDKEDTILEPICYEEYLVTEEALLIADSSVCLYAKFFDLEKEDISEVGFYYYKSEEKEKEEKIEGKYVKGGFISEVKHLVPEVEYYFQAYIVLYGEEYRSGEVEKFKTGSVVLSVPKDTNMVFVEEGLFVYSEDWKIHIRNSFYISKYEVTNEEYLKFIYDREVKPDGTLKGRKCIDLSSAACDIEYDNGFRIKNDKRVDLRKCPVRGMSLIGAQEYIKWYSEKMGELYRLPTEYEWRYAASGGLSTKGYKYIGSNNIEEVSWYRNNSERTSHVVGVKKPNELGLYDMGGNVKEWVISFIDYAGIDFDQFRNGFLFGEFEYNWFELLGGSYYSEEKFCTIFSTTSTSCESDSDENGFRIAYGPMNLEFIDY
ncbi:MAG: formylglycine-generating enzyme family protein [Hyphomicrobiales bacterium]